MQRKRDYSFDTFKFFAVFFVVLIHTQPFSNTMIGANINTFSRWAVPFFFAVSGYFLGLKGFHDSKAIPSFKKYWVKIAKLFVTWSLFYLIVDSIVLLQNAVRNGQDMLPVLKTYISNVLNPAVLYYGMDFGSLYHLWYLAALLYSVAVLLVFVKLKRVGLLLIVSFLLHLIGLFGQAYSAIYDFPVITRDALFFGLFYLTMGYWIAAKRSFFQTINISKQSLFLISFVMLLLPLAERAAVFHIFGEGSRGNNYYVSTIPLTASLMMLAINQNHIGKGTFIAAIGSEAVGIYVAHPLFINLMYLGVSFLGVDYITKTTVWQISITPVVFIASYLFYTSITVIKRKSIGGFHYGKGRELIGKWTKTW